MKITIRPLAEADHARWKTLWEGYLTFYKAGIDDANTTALIEAVYEKATAAGASEVYWMTQEFNSIARVLYDRVGERTPFIKYRMLM